MKRFASLMLVLFSLASFSYVNLSCNTEDISIETKTTTFNRPGNIVNTGIVAHHGDWYYYRNPIDGDKLYKVHANGGSPIKLNEESSWYINATDEWIYYSDFKNPFQKDECISIISEGSIVNYSVQFTKQINLCKIRTDGSERTIFEDIHPDVIFVLGDWIYFCNKNDDNKIYKIRSNGKGLKRINKEKSSFVNVVGEWIYYSNDNDGGRIYKIRTDGRQRSRVNDDWSYGLNVADEWIYYKNRDDVNRLYRIRIDGSDRSKLSDDYVSGLVLDGDWIYYGNWSDAFNLYKIRTDGSERTKLNDDRIMQFNVVDGWIFYFNLTDEKALYKIRTDGSQRQRVS